MRTDTRTDTVYLEVKLVTYNKLKNTGKIMLDGKGMTFMKI